jgi:EAL domain-containing protein (putative c-di-GMP-specific phosphodiesterase class I)
MAELRDAIEGGQISTVYQPLVRLDDGVCDLVETLVRWQHPGRGFVGAEEFVPLAEVTGLINPLTPYVLDLAVAQQAAWDRRQVGVTVSVNISVQNLLGDRLLLEMYQLLDRYSVEPERLCLEITESMIMVDPVKSIETLKALSGMGIRLAVDDFGTGASSLAYLRTLPVDEVKLDRSFLSHITSDHFERTLVKGIVELGHSLGLTVVAEGVEETGQMELLADLGCDYGQGYLFGAAVDGEQFVAWYRGWNERVKEGSPPGSQGSR